MYKKVFIAKSKVIGFVFLLVCCCGYSSNTVKAAGIYGSGGGTWVVGQQFTVNITASGDSFDSLQGSLAVSGPVTVVSVAPGGATWLPSKSPAIGKQFVGITSPTNSLLVAKVTLRGNSPGSGSVSVTGVKLARSGTIVGTDGGSASFTITRQLVPPGAVKVSSTTHPDSSQSYETTTVDLSWALEKGVTNVAYILDQVEGTVPVASTMNANTTAKYENLAIGTYFFHIRALNGDGWGPVAHFKINIKEPDPKIDESLPKPILENISKMEGYSTDLINGTMTGVVLSGKNVPGYKLNLNIPSITPPEGFVLVADTNEEGGWTIALDFPVKAGFYTMTIQGQKEKVLTPVSEPIRFEVSLANEGKIRLITENDAVKPPLPPIAEPTPKVKHGLALISVKHWIMGGVSIAFLLIVGLMVWLYFHHKKRKNKASSSK